MVEFMVYLEDSWICQRTECGVWEKKRNQDDTKEYIHNFIFSRLGSNITSSEKLSLTSLSLLSHCSWAFVCNSVRVIICSHTTGPRVLEVKDRILFSPLYQEPITELYTWIVFRTCWLNYRDINYSSANSLKFTVTSIPKAISDSFTDF